MKKFICTALTLAMVVGSLAGCGSSASKETTAAGGSATEAATEAAQTEAATDADKELLAQQQQAILIQAKKSVLTHVKMVQVQEALSLNCLV